MKNKIIFIVFLLSTYTFSNEALSGIDKFMEPYYSMSVTWKYSLSSSGSISFKNKGLNDTIITFTKNYPEIYYTQHNPKLWKDIFSNGKGIKVDSVMLGGCLCLCDNYSFDFVFSDKSKSKITWNVCGERIGLVIVMKGEEQYFELVGENKELFNSYIKRLKIMLIDNINKVESK